MKNMNHLNKVLLLSLISLSLISSNVSAGWFGRPRSNSAPAAISASGARRAGGACVNWIRNHPGRTAVGAAALAGAGLAAWGIKRACRWYKNRPEGGNANTTGGNEGAGSREGSGESAPKKTWGDTARNVGSYALVPIRLARRHPYATTAVALPTVTAVLAWACPQARNAVVRAAQNAAGRVVPQRVSNHPWLSAGSAVAGSAALVGSARGVQAASACCARQERRTQECVLKLAEYFMCEANLAADPENAVFNQQRSEIIQWLDANGKQQDVCRQLTLNEGNPASVMLNLLSSYSRRDWARSAEQTIKVECTIEGQAYTLPGMFRTYKQNVAAARKSGEAQAKQRQINAWLGMMEERIEAVRSVVTALMVQVPAEAPAPADDADQ